MLIVHHLGLSQSERIVWLMEELGLPYELKVHTRDPVMSPESLKTIPGNDIGRAPFLQDTEGNITLYESGAICEYIIQKYANNRLSAIPSDSNFAEYLLWFHYANGTLQPAFVDSLLVSAAGGPEDSFITQIVAMRLQAALTTMDNRLKAVKWLAGDFSAADIMALYTTSTQRYTGPGIDLSKYEGILRWMKDCGERPAYQRAMQKGDPEMEPLLGGAPPQTTLLAAGGVTADFWKKK